jgi:hypothetical protein
VPLGPTVWAVVQVPLRHVSHKPWSVCFERFGRGSVVSPGASGQARDLRFCEVSEGRTVRIPLSAESGRNPWSAWVTVHWQGCRRQMDLPMVTSFGAFQRRRIECLRRDIVSDTGCMSVSRWHSPADLDVVRER